MFSSNPALTSIEALLADPENISEIAAIPACISRLDHLGCIELTGEDSEDFLQGQLTNELSAISPWQSQLSGYCNPKGRALAIFRVLKTETSICLLCPQDLVESMIKRLQLYKMRAKVEVKARDDLQAFGLINVGTETPRTTDWLWQIDHNRKIAIATEEQSDPLLGRPHPITDSSLWRLTDILAGQPQVYAATSEAFIPQQINLDLVDGVSFTKGCYPGQEIVARLRYLGKLKQRMIAGKVKCDQSIVPGTPLFTSERPKQKSGSVVDVVETGGYQVLLAMVPASYIDSGELMLIEHQGNKLERLQLPYAITLEKN